jgi:hypothetical protein
MGRNNNRLRCRPRRCNRRRRVSSSMPMQGAAVDSDWATSLLRGGGASFRKCFYSFIVVAVFNLCSCARVSDDVDGARLLPCISLPLTPLSSSRHRAPHFSSGARHPHDALS